MYLFVIAYFVANNKNDSHIKRTVLLDYACRGQKSSPLGDSVTTSMVINDLATDIQTRSPICLFSIRFHYDSI